MRTASHVVAEAELRLGLALKAAYGTPVESPSRAYRHHLAMARLTDAQASGALELALERASSQLLEMPVSEVMTDDDLGWTFDGPGRSWILVEGERQEATSNAVPVVLTAYLRGRFRARAVASRQVVVPLS